MLKNIIEWRPEKLGGFQKIKGHYSRKEKVLIVKNQTFMVTDLLYQFQMVC